MRTFNPEEIRKSLLGECGVSLCLGMDEATMRSEGACAVAARSFINTAVRAFLVGLDTEARALLERSAYLIRVAVDEGQIPRYYFKGDYEASNLNSLALCHWLLDRPVDASLFQAASDHLSAVLTSRTPKGEFAARLPTFILARRYGEVVRLVEEVKPELAGPASRKIKCPGRMSYLIARHHLQGEPNAHTLGKAFRSFLAYYVPCCLLLNRFGAYGVPEDLIPWMYLYQREFGDPSQRPRDALLQACPFISDFVEEVRSGGGPSHSFMVYWSQWRCGELRKSGDVGSTWSILFGGPDPSMPEFGRCGVQPGDWIYPVRLHAGVLFVLGRVRVRQLLPLADFIQQHPGFFSESRQEPHLSAVNGVTQRPGQPLSDADREERAAQFLEQWLNRNPERRYLSPARANEVMIGEAGSLITLDAPMPPDLLKRLKFGNGSRLRGISDGKLASNQDLESDYRRMSPDSAKAAERLLVDHLRTLPE